MSYVAAAIAGSAILSSIMNDRAADQAAETTTHTAEISAAAQIQQTQMAIDEMRRQFDFEMRILLPQVQQQYNAQRAYSDILGVGGPEYTPPPWPSSAPVGTVQTAQSTPASTENMTAAQAVFTGGTNSTDSYITGLPVSGTSGSLLTGVPMPSTLSGLFGRSGGAQTQDTGAGRGMAERPPYGFRDWKSFNIFAQDNPERAAAILQNLRNDQRIVVDPPRPTPQSTSQNVVIDQQTGSIFPSMGTPGSSGPGSTTGSFRDETGRFIDPNLDPTRLADTETLSGTVRANLLADTGAEDDPFRRYVRENHLAAATPEESAMARRVAGTSLMGARGDERIAGGAAGRGVYGDVFTESPGYAFQREEMERQLERVRSAGGPNIGGRAVMEAQRRAQGLAAGDYYNWAAGRTRDLERLGTAEAQDISRRDRFSATDIERGDTATRMWEEQRLRDIGRSDVAYENYLARRQGDVTRLDQAASARDLLAATDIQRGDQAYYNYLANVAQMAGFGGGPSSKAVGAAQSQGTNVANAYMNQGSGLSNIYQDLGASMANIRANETANYGNIINSAIQNWLTYQNSQPSQYSA